MASQMIGRATCPECSFGSAHVKRSEKCLYRHCPECGAQYYATGERRAADLMAKTRVDKPGSGATPTGSEKAPETAVPATPAATPTPTEPSGTAAPKRRGLFG
jgi:hypothetical protein